MSVTLIKTTSPPAECQWSAPLFDVHDSRIVLRHVTLTNPANLLLPWAGWTG
jgi:hypothetical protein